MYCNVLYCIVCLRKQAAHTFPKWLRRSTSPLAEKRLKDLSLLQMFPLTTYHYVASHVLPASCGVNGNALMFDQYRARERNYVPPFKCRSETRHFTGTTNYTILQLATKMTHFMKLYSMHACICTDIRIVTYSRNWCYYIPFSSYKSFRTAMSFFFTV
jgi:hypothetical protein